MTVALRLLPLLLPGGWVLGLGPAGQHSHPSSGAYEQQG